MLTRTLDLIGFSVTRVQSALAWTFSVALTLLFLAPHPALSAGFTISGSTFSLASSVTLNVNGGVTVNSGEVLLNNATQIQVAGDIVLTGGGALGATNAAQIILGGNWTNNGSFVAGTSTVTFTGNTPTLTGSTTFYNMAYSVGGGNMAFVAGTTQTVQGLLTFTGAAGNLITLQPTVAGQEWYLDNSGTNNVSFVNVTHSDARAGNTINAANSTDSGLNFNWFFGGSLPPGVPTRPGGLRYTVLSAGGPSSQIRLDWNAVLYDTNGNAFPPGSPPTYLVLVSSTIPTDSTDFIAGGATSVSNPTITLTLPNGPEAFVAVKALGAGGQSGLSMIFHFPVLTLASPSDDPISRYELNSTANQNLFTSPDGSRRSWVMLLKGRSDLGSNVVKFVDVYVTNTDNGQTVSDFFDSSGGGMLYIGYIVQGNQVVQGSGPIPLLLASQARNGLSLFLFNGADWVKAGGQVDTVGNQVTYRTGRVGLFQIRVAGQSGLASLVQVYPRIITPNGDGLNDVAIFQFGEGNTLGSDVTGEIFNIRGQKVADLRTGPDPLTTLQWDGKDSDGRTVPSGIYIYQIKASGSRVNGTIVVAR